LMMLTMSATSSTTRGARASTATTHRRDAFVRVMRREFAPCARASATRAATPISSSSSRRYRQSRRAASRRRPSTRVDAALGPIPETTFAIATACVMPLYALMIAKPRSRRVAALVESKGTFWILGACYLCAAYASFMSADVFDLVRNVLGDFGRGGMVAQFVTLVSEFMATAETAASAWVHLVALDLFVARFVYLDAAKYSASEGDLVAPVPVRHSLVLCCMFGPLGLMSHAITRWFWNTFVVVDVV